MHQELVQNSFHCKIEERLLVNMKDNHSTKLIIPDSKDPLATLENVKVFRFKIHGDEKQT